MFLIRIIAICFLCLVCQVPAEARHRNWSCGPRPCGGGFHPTARGLTLTWSYQWGCWVYAPAPAPLVSIKVNQGCGCDKACPCGKDTPECDCQKYKK